MNRKQIENIVWHIETNRRVAGDKQVLDDVLKSLKNFLKETAQEVPVQEQLKTLEFINKEFDINLSQKQYDDIAIFDFCTQKYTAYEILRLLKLLDII